MKLQYPNNKYLYINIIAVIIDYFTSNKLVHSIFYINFTYG